jgi:amino acid adenylation domain-containing protein
MEPGTPLHALFLRAAARGPDRIAVREPGGPSITYRELEDLAARVRDRLAARGVGRGDRGGGQLHKSIDAVAAILGILECGAAYVPVDPTAPAARNAYIYADCSVKVLIVEAAARAAVLDEMAKLGARTQVIAPDGVGGGVPLRAALEAPPEATPAASAPADSAPDDLAYILYTSGSTGRPKGVMLSHRNATSFIGWCIETLGPVADDVFSSHAPFHFDLSILDLYVPLATGASLVLIPEDTGKEPLALAELIERERITMWYSTPSILSLLVQYGKLETRDTSRVRTVCFAGEVFPIVHLRALTAIWPAKRYLNLYGPTETNVCTWHEVPAAIPAGRTEPFPIGRVCSHLEALVLDASGEPVGEGGEGELCIRGAGVMQGYWNLPDQTARAFVERPDPPSGRVPRGRWYRTGDLVVAEAGGIFIFRGRNDRMVKKRGYRVELGEIEVSLYRHPAVREAAVVAVTDAEAGVTIRAHLATRDGGRLSIIELKRFCASHLPRYMIPDSFSFHAELPRTSTDKTDYQRLIQMG